jgi:predicted aminopeptidase
MKRAAACQSTSDPSVWSAMYEPFIWARWQRRLCAILAFGILNGTLCGCQTAHYYSQAIRGEYNILSQRQPIARLETDQKTSPKLRAQFELIGRLRRFAEKDLKLPIDKHYLTYVDLKRPFAVWNVHAAPEFSLTPKKWWYPFVGSLKYRGYFAEDGAHAYAKSLQKNGDDVYVEGVEAYSTLGWFADPLLNTFIFSKEPELAEVIFHELAHQRLFFSGDTDFNEAFATVVAEEGVRRWFLTNSEKTLYRNYQIETDRNRQFVSLVMQTRERLEQLYAAQKQPSSPGREQEREEKARIAAQLREDYVRLKASWGGYSGYDHWFSQSLNNAQLNTVALYYDLVPGFQALLQNTGSDLEQFYVAVEKLKALSKKQRHERLHQLAGENTKAANRS